MNVQNTEAWNVFRERSEQGVSAVPGSLGYLLVSSFYMPVTCIIGKVSVVLGKKIPRISSAQENHRRVSRISCNGCAPVLASGRQAPAPPPK